MVYRILGTLLRPLTSIITLSLLLCACTGKTDKTDTDTDDTSPSCSETQPEACLYANDNSYSVEKQTTVIDDEDRVGGPRAITLQFYDPSQVDDGLPLLFLTPGGTLGSGQNPAAKSADAWAQSLASSGYLVVVVDLRERPEERKNALCEHLGIPEAQCAGFRSETWDAPKDVLAALDWLQSSHPDNTWSDRVLSSQIGHVGQELGASTSLMLAGASRKFGETSHDFSDTRFEAVLPIAIVSERPGDEFISTGLSNVDLPIYMTGGVNGYQSSNIPIDTPDAFSNLPAGDKYLLHFLDENASIATFHLEDAKCDDCEVFISWLTTSSVAFADAMFKDEPEAIDWLASDNMAIAIGSQAEWLSR